jgi:hypothetical protein
VKVALPLARDALPGAVDPLLNVTVPVGVVVPEVGETLAVKVTLVPALACEVETVNAVVVVRRKVAVTDCAALIDTVQLPVPVQAPLHPAKAEPVAAVSAKVTLVPPAKFALQVPGHLMPVGVLATVPDPLPAIVTDSGKVTGALKVAVTDCAAIIVTVQRPVPAQPPPLHPAKVDPAVGVSVRVTLVPLAKLALQAPGQLMLGGVLETVPLPVPARVTVRGNVVAPVQLGKLKVAMRVFQLNTPVVLMYSWVYQNVQSSTGSMCMAL